MKQRYRILFSLPIGVGIATAVFAWLFFLCLVDFEKTYQDEARLNLKHKTELAAEIIKPLLNSNNLEAARAFCDNFNNDTLRLSLIRADGKVEADSSENATFLGNHLDREEIKAALSGAPGPVTRYSTSLNQQMTYYAVELKTSGGNYILRSAMSTLNAYRAANMAENTIYLALFLGGTLVFFLTVYIINKVRRPLHMLQNAIGEIAGGNLEVNIAIPQSGIVRELASGISGMAEQLKKHLAEMTEERNEKEAILNTMSEAVLLVAANNDALRINRSAERLFGLKRGVRFNLSRSGIAGLLPVVRRTFQTGEAFEKEFEMQKGSGKLPLLIKGCMLPGVTERYLLLTVTDLTSQRKLESFRSDFIANVSHEIKTPLTCIIGAAETIHDEPKLSKEQFDKLVKMIFEQSNQLNLLVQDILSLSKLERKRLNLQQDFTQVRLDTVILNAVKFSGERAAEAGIDLQITGNEPLEISGDSQLLEQAVCNLINNAIKYSGSERIDVELRKNGQDAQIIVRDYGIGIPAEHQGRIFERFYRVHKERSRSLGGTGLGLAIVKHTAALHNGRVELDSQTGHGCTFRIILPL